MRDLVVDLRRIARQTDAPGAVAPDRKKTRGWVWIPAAVLTVMLIVAVFFWRNDSIRQEPVQYVQLTNFADSATQPTLSPDSRMMAFVRGPETLMGPGQIYVNLLPSGDPVQLTHDNMLKMAPRFSADGARIATRS